MANVEVGFKRDLINWLINLQNVSPENKTWIEERLVPELKARNIKNTPTVQLTLSEFIQLLARAIPEIKNDANLLTLSQLTQRYRLQLTPLEPPPSKKPGGTPSAS